MTSPAALDPAYELTTERDRIDVARVHRLLLDHAYWAAVRSREQQEAIVAASRNYGLLERATGQQVGYARIVTDGVTFAWLADVVVDPAHRSRGLGADLVDGILADLEPLGLRRVLLKASTEGAPLYVRAGFEALEDPDAWMVRRRR